MAVRKNKKLSLQDVLNAINEDFNQNFSSNINDDSNDENCNSEESNE